jgi:hypothetical protein
MQKYSLSSAELHNLLMNSPRINMRSDTTSNEFTNLMKITILRINYFNYHSKIKMENIEK